MIHKYLTSTQISSFFIVVLILSSTYVLSQDIGVQVDRNQGIIEGIFIKKDKIVFELDSSNSNIKNIYVFSTTLSLKDFLMNLYLILDQGES